MQCRYDKILNNILAHDCMRLNYANHKYVTQAPLLLREVMGTQYEELNHDISTFNVTSTSDSKWSVGTASQTTSVASRIPECKYNHCSNKHACPTWFTCNLDNKCRCQNSENDGIICDNEKLLSALLVCYCVTYDEESASTYTGPCFFNCEHFNAINTNGDERQVYDRLPQNPEKLINDSACTHFHRRGLLCGDCEEGHSPLVLSYNLSCVPCPDGQRNWWKFILAGFIPITLFYLFVVLFNINVTSSHLHGFVWVSQMGTILPLST